MSPRVLVPARAKPFTESRTFWVNVLTLAASVIGIVAASDLLAENGKLVALLTGIVVPVINVILRFLTGQPVSARWRAKPYVGLLIVALALVASQSRADVWSPSDQPFRRSGSVILSHDGYQVVSYGTSVLKRPVRKIHPWYRPTENHPPEILPDRGAATVRPPAPRANHDYGAVFTPISTVPDREYLDSVGFGYSIGVGDALPSPSQLPAECVGGS